MKWETIVDLAREALGERDGTFFTETKMRVAGARIQAEIAELSRCIESQWTIHTVQCSAVSTTNITLTTATTSVDGVTLAAGDNVCVAGQTTSTSNGIYVVPSTAGAWTRLSSMASAMAGTKILHYYAVITGGTAYEDTQWKLTTIPQTVGNNPLAFTQQTANDIWSYELPPGFLDIVDIQADTEPLSQLVYQPNVQVYPTGQPTHFYMDGQYLGLYPQPSAEMDIKFTYRRTTPTCGFQFWYDAALTGASATACTCKLVDNNFTIVATLAGLTSGTASLSLTTNYTTVGALVDYINTTLRGITSSGIKPFAGCRAVIDPDIDYYTKSTTLSNIYDALDCFGRDAFVYIMVNPEVPNEAHNIIVHGIIDSMKFKDRESANSAYERSMYQQLLDRFVKKYRLRDTSVELDGLNRKRGNSPYMDETMTILIP